MKKKLLSLLVASAMVLSLAACGGKKENTTPSPEPEKTVEFSGEIKVWVADAVVDFTKEKAEAWKNANEAYKNCTITVEPVGEGDAAGKVTTDVEAAGDIFGFAQDQLGKLVAASGLAPVVGANAEFVKTNNDGGAVGAATLGELTYAYPMTSDNGYFLYYDKSIVKDPTKLDAIVADCKAAGKNFYFQINSGWYSVAMYFAAGCEITYDYNSDGSVKQANVSIANDKGVAATKALIELAKNNGAGFANGSSIGAAANCGAIIDGTWDSDAAKDLFGDNYACAKCPTFTLDGKQVQMGGFGGFKLLGVKPQTDAAKLAACHSLAKYLTSEEVQLDRFNKHGWGPSNLNAQKSDAVKANPALAALAEQLNYTIPQGQYPSDAAAGYWVTMEAFGDSIIAGDYKDATDAQILEALKSLEAKLKAAK